MRHVTAPPSDVSNCPLSSSSVFGLGGLGLLGSRTAPPPPRAVTPPPAPDHEEAQEEARDRGRTLPEFHEWKRKEVLRGAYGPDTEEYPQETLDELCREYNVTGLDIKIFPGQLFDPDNETANRIFEVSVPPRSDCSPRARTDAQDLLFPGLKPPLLRPKTWRLRSTFFSDSQFGSVQEEAEYACRPGSGCCDAPKGEVRDEDEREIFAPTLVDRVRMHTEDNSDLKLRSLEEDIQESMGWTEEQARPLPINRRMHPFTAAGFMPRRARPRMFACRCVMMRKHSLMDEYCLWELTLGWSGPHARATWSTPVHLLLIVFGN